MDVASGVTISNCYRRHRHQEFIRFLNEIEANLPSDFDVHSVMDNYGTHKVAKVKSWLTKHPRHHVHFTPTSASWLNLVERLFAELTQRCVRRGIRTAIRALEKAMLDYLDRRNQNPKPFVWTPMPISSSARSKDFVNVFPAQDSSTTVLQTKHFDVELFCSYALRARPTREALCGIYGWPGKSRRAR